MAETVTRLAHELLDGDEIIEVIQRPDGMKSVGLIKEKTLDEDGNVVLMLVLDDRALVRTFARPREMNGPFDA